MLDEELSALLRSRNGDHSSDVADVATVFRATLALLARTSPEAARAILSELADQRSNLKLIASENFSSLAVQFAQANLFTDKYAEGYPGHRFYAGCENVDAIESLAVEAAKELFGAEHAFVQPHSGSDANLVAFLAILATRVKQPLLDELPDSDAVRASREDWNRIRGQVHGQKILAQDFFSGGHLTHGYRHNYSALMFDVHTYGVDPATNLIDLAALREQAREVRPLILLAGYSAYARRLNFAKLREIASEVGAVLMVDMAHFAGLVAGKVLTGDYDPVRWADVVTSTTHKTLRGPRGGLVLCTEEFVPAVDGACPAVLGGPIPQAMLARVVAFREALQPKFREYAASVVENARALAESFVRRGAKVLSGGTDNHMVLVDVAESWGLTGRQAESALRECAVTLNRNAVPGDAYGPWYTSGLRLGSAAVTTLGMGTAEMETVGRVMCEVLAATRPRKLKKGGTSRAKYETEKSVAERARGEVRELLAEFPLYPELGSF